MASQYEKGTCFRSLHEGPGVFLMPNPWDEGSARALRTIGFPALATSSFASAGAHGQLDGGMKLADTLAHIATIAGATDLPVSADLEECFGDDPATVAATISLAAEAGAVGGSVDDATESYRVTTSGTPQSELPLLSRPRRRYRSRSY